MALPAMLMMFMTRLASILMRLLPCARNSAAPPLYSPMKGYDTALMRKYCWANRMTSSSMLPNTPRRIGRESSIQTTPTVMVEMPSTLYSWAALWLAFSSSLRPRYWLAMTAPPVARADRI